MMKAVVTDELGRGTIVSSGFWLEESVLFYEECDRQIARADGGHGAMQLQGRFSVSFFQEENVVLAMGRVFRDAENELALRNAASLAELPRKEEKSPCLQTKSF